MEIASGERARRPSCTRCELKRDLRRRVRYHVPPRFLPPRRRSLGASRSPPIGSSAAGTSRAWTSGWTPPAQPRFLECNPLPGLDPDNSDLAILSRGRPARTATSCGASCVERGAAPGASPLPGSHADPDPSLPCAARDGRPGRLGRVRSLRRQSRSSPPSCRRRPSPRCGATPREILSSSSARGPTSSSTLCEAPLGRPDLEAHVAALLEWAGVRFTGSASETLALCRRKDRVDAVLAAAGVPVPRTRAVFPASSSPRTRTARRASSQHSVCGDAARGSRARERPCAARRDRQEFLPGREFAVSLWGQREPEHVSIGEFAVPATVSR